MCLIFLHVFIYIYIFQSTIFSDVNVLLIGDAGYM